MNVANGDCRTPPRSSSSEFDNPSNRRLPPPRMRGAMITVSWSTRPAANAWRMMSAASGCSSGRCVTMKNGTPRGSCHPSARRPRRSNARLRQHPSWQSLAPAIRTPVRLKYWTRGRSQTHRHGGKGHSGAEFIVAQTGVTRLQTPRPGAAKQGAWWPAFSHYVVGGSPRSGEGARGRRFTSDRVARRVRPPCAPLAVSEVA